MKYAALCLFMFVSTSVMSQHWSAGLNVNPYLYWYHNATDNKHYGELSRTIRILYPSSFVPNGFAVGIPVEYHSDNIWYLSSGLDWNTQSQSYMQDTIWSSSTFTFDTRMDYIRIPAMIGLKYKTGYSGNFLFFGIGPQVSFLTNFIEERESTSRVHNTRFRLSIQNYRARGWSWKDGELINNFDVKTSYYIYRRFLIGAIAEAGFNIVISDMWSVKFALRADIDLSNVDNLDATYRNPPEGLNPKYWYRRTRDHFTGLLPEDDPIRSKSTQWRVGLNVAIIRKIK